MARVILHTGLGYLVATYAVFVKQQVHNYQLTDRQKFIIALLIRDYLLSEFIAQSELYALNYKNYLKVTIFVCMD